MISTFRFPSDASWRHFSVSFDVPVDLHQMILSSSDLMKFDRNAIFLNNSLDQTLEPFHTEECVSIGQTTRKPSRINQRSRQFSLIDESRVREGQGKPKRSMNRWSPHQYPSILLCPMWECSIICRPFLPALFPWRSVVQIRWNFLRISPMTKKKTVAINSSIRDGTNLESACSYMGRIKNKERVRRDEFGYEKWDEFEWDE